MAWGPVLALIVMLVAAIAPAHADDLPASRTNWQYLGYDGSSFGYCASDENDAMTQTISAKYANACSASFKQWTSSWPNTDGMTTYYQACPPANIPYLWGYVHREERTFSSNVVGRNVNNGCPGGASTGAESIHRQSFYYCPAGYSLTTAYPSTVPFCRSSLTVLIPEKQPVCSPCTSSSTPSREAPPTAGNPINLASGFKYQRERDYAGTGLAPLLWERHYRNGTWSTTYSRRLIVLPVAAPVGTHTLPYLVLRVVRDDGRVFGFNNSAVPGNVWSGDADVPISVVSQYDGSGNVLGHTLTDENDSVETYDSAGRLVSVRTRAGALTTLTYDTSGRLQSVVGPFGHALAISYDASGRLSGMTAPGGAVYSYTYDLNGNLQTVTSPDAVTKTYVYNEPANTSGADLPNRLTGIIDESGTRYATYRYDTQGRAISSEHAGGADLTTVTYNANGTTTVTDALGAARTYTFSVLLNVGHVTAISGSPCTTCGLAASYSYDTKGNVGSRTEFNGRVTGYSYSSDGRNLETQRTEAQGTGIWRTWQTQWHPTFRLPTQITLYTVKQTNFTYDAGGNPLTRVVKDVPTAATRTWTYTYDAYGHVLTEDGPRTDVTDLTTYSYYTCTTGAQCGQLQTVTNALNQTTTYNAYNAHGQPTQITDPNGLVTTLAYDARQRLADRCFNGTLPGCTGGELTHFDYWPTGKLKKVTQSDGSYLQYTYDAAQRLTQIADGDGNRIVYTLDAMGNRTQEQAFDPSNALARNRYRAFNTLNQLWKEIGAANTAAVTTTFGYDASGNQTSVAAPLGRATSNTYDVYDRLSQITDPANKLTKFAYDALDNLTQVTDPRNLITSYQYNAFGDVKQLTSPDTGVTQYTFDSGGNLKTQVDARNKTGTYSYDALNRVTQLVYPDQTIGYTYDAGTNGTGRLTGVSDASGTTAWTYTAQGRVASRAQTVTGTVIRTISYGYNAAGQMTSITLPSGNVIGYSYSQGKVSGLTLNGTTTILSAVLYDPFGPVRGWTWGNGTSSTTRTYDLDGKVTLVASGGAQKTYGYDDAFRITGITDSGNAALSWTYGYDVMDRLTSATKTGLTQGWTYDANGNRLTQTGTSASTYTVSTTSNRVSSITGALPRTYGYDAAGNTTGDGRSFTYNDAGRLVSATSGGVTLSSSYNALGQRVKKSSSAGTRYYLYDEAGHLVGDYDSGGTVWQETVWLGDTPVAVLHNPGTGVQLLYVHSDHLNAPRKLSRPADNVVVWSWESDPFGSTAANADPDGDATQVAFPLRFPGQYFDAETGLNYNFFRDYDSAIGRYVQSDPVGLAAGVNTYAYVGGIPTSLVDPTGLQARDHHVPTAAEVQELRERDCARRALKKNYEDMVRLSWKFSDKYFHCKGNCEAARCGPYGFDEACSVSDLREIYGFFKGDPRADSAADQAANQYGRNGARSAPGQTCQTICAPFRPRGLPAGF